MRSLADKEAEAAARKPLAQWPDAELLERFADSRVLPLVRRRVHGSQPGLMPGSTDGVSERQPFLNSIAKCNCRRAVAQAAGFASPVSHLQN